MNSILLFIIKYLLVNGYLLRLKTVSGLKSWLSIGDTRSGSSGGSGSLRGSSSSTVKASSSLTEIRSDSPPNEFSDSGNNNEGHYVQLVGTDLMKPFDEDDATLKSKSNAEILPDEDLQLAFDEGITFSRSINIQDEDALNVHFEFDTNHCDSSDKYGDNRCHYRWGETLRVDIDVNMTEPFVETDRVYASMKVDYFVPWNLDCAVCGEDCTLKIPVVDFEITIPMLPCPLTVGDIPTILDIPLGDASPFDGVPLHAAGDIYLKRNSSEVLAWGHVVVDVQ